MTPTIQSVGGWKWVTQNTDPVLVEEDTESDTPLPSSVVAKGTPKKFAKRKFG
jgi:hypothetical protein